MTVKYPIRQKTNEIYSLQTWHTRPKQVLVEDINLRRITTEQLARDGLSPYFYPQVIFLRIKRPVANTHYPTSGRHPSVGGCPRNTKLSVHSRHPRESGDPGH